MKLKITIPIWIVAVLLPVSASAVIENDIRRESAILEAATVFRQGAELTHSMKMMEYYKSKSTELADEIVIFTERKTEVTEKINSLTRQIDLEKRKNDKVAGQLFLNLLSPGDGDFTATISYYTGLASWEPCYDLKTDGIDKPLKIIYKADISQTTGIDWNKVTLTLSTVIPSNGKVAPIPRTWFLEYVSPASLSLSKSQASAMQNRMSYEVSEQVVEPALNSEAPLRLRGTANLAGRDPVYIIDGMEVSNDYFASLDPSSIKSMSVLKDDATSIYGSRAANGAIVITLKSGMDDYVTSSESEIDLTYKIDMPYTIAGNGKPQNVVLRSAETEVDYRYYCVPKLDRAVFLTASIKNRETLNLLPGKANITVEGSYMGTTFIEPNSTRETLDLTLGQDSRITVKREKIQDMSSVRFLGSDVRQEFSFRISVINTKTTPVRMIVKDQYPLSTQKDIVVDNVGFTGKPHENKEIGTLTWEFELFPGKTESFDLRFSVKYPRGRSLNL